MASFELLCPHCSGRFELANPPRGGQVACPRCGRSVAIPADVPKPVAERRVTRSKPPPSRPKDADEGEAEPVLLPYDEDEPRPEAQPPVEASPPVPTSEAVHEAPVVRVSREEKARRRQMRSLIWMIVGVVLLAIAVIVLTRM